MLAVLSTACGSSNGGTGQTGAGGENGDTEPNLVVAELRSNPITSVDLLFVVDNSMSMIDKQLLLRQAVPVLLNRLVQPICVGASGEPLGVSSDASGHCPSGKPEFKPVSDIHLGIVTSSLGPHGGQTCVTPDEDDKAHLLGTVRPDAVPPLVSWMDAGGTSMGFLAWDPDVTRPRNVPPGESDANVLITQFQNMLAATGENGCAHESTLEAWYRFLVDPDPPSQVEAMTDANGVPTATLAVFDPPDRVLLAQRAAFLRPDSLLGIVLFTDENDCSVRDEGQGFLTGTVSIGAELFHLPRSTSACLSNPNAACCVSCDADPRSVPSQCGAIEADPECVRGAYGPREDALNLRCFDQKRRFGFDLLYGVNERYVPALTQRSIASRRVDASGNAVMVPNPLFTGLREPSQIFLAGIVGVPWQDVATEESLAGPGLEYMTYTELVDHDRWSLILGDPGDAVRPPTLPRDALMVETDGDRTGLPPHPLLGVAVAPTTAPNNANPINGHESVIDDGTDLQYACTFPLSIPRPCDPMDNTCECKLSEQKYNRSICNGTTQTHAKAYPGVRHLRLLRAFGEMTGNSIVASICPKFLDPTEEAFGYVPAVNAMIQRFREALRDSCLPRSLEVDERTGRVPCAVIEARLGADASCEPCSALPGRSDPAEETRAAVQRELRTTGYCDNAVVSCEEYCLCEVEQFSGNDLTRCQLEPLPPSDIYGYCYVDPSQQSPGSAESVAQDEIVNGCPVTRRRLLRFTGSQVPIDGAVPFLVCAGSAFGD